MKALTQEQAEQRALEIWEEEYPDDLVDIGDGLEVFKHQGEEGYGWYAEDDECLHYVGPALQDYRDPYEALLEKVQMTGVEKTDRTGTGTKSLFAEQIRYDLSRGFPLITTKKVHWKSVAHELLWFLRGDSNVAYLKENGVSIWDEWARPDGELGPVYGVQWRSWPTPDGGTIDQISRVIEDLRTKPDSRRMVVSAWNVADIDRMALPPCHLLFQFYVAEGRLSCQVYQRSADVFLGVPFNIASYALLTHLVAQVTNLKVGELVLTFGDVHLYKNHEEQAKEQLTRSSRRLPRLVLDPAVERIDDFRFEHLTLTGYEPHPGISAPVAV